MDYPGIEKFFEERYAGWEGATQFQGTGERLKRMIEETCWKPRKVKEKLEECFKAVYDDPYDRMLVEGPITAWTFCPHHLVPCNFQIHIGYIPNGKVIGLSKLVRAAVILGKRPVMQEMYSRELVDSIQKHLAPKGVGIVVIGTHGCMACRGVQQNVKAISSELGGCFHEPDVKEEFLSLVRSQNGRQ